MERFDLNTQAIRNALVAPIVNGYGQSELAFSVLMRSDYSNKELCMKMAAEHIEPLSLGNTLCSYDRNDTLPLNQRLALYKCALAASKSAQTQQAFCNMMKVAQIDPEKLGKLFCEDSQGASLLSLIITQCPDIKGVAELLNDLIENKKISFDPKELGMALIAFEASVQFTQHGILSRFVSNIGDKDVGPCLRTLLITAEFPTIQDIPLDAHKNYRTTVTTYNNMKQEMIASYEAPLSSSHLLGEGSNNYADE